MTELMIERPYLALDATDRRMVNDSVQRFRRYAELARLKAGAKTMPASPIKKSRATTGQRVRVKERILEYIAKHQPCTVVAIAQATGIARTTVLKRAAQMERDGLLVLAKLDYAGDNLKRSKFFAIPEENAQ